MFVFNKIISSASVDLNIYCTLLYKITLHDVYYKDCLLYSHFYSIQMPYVSKLALWGKKCWMRCPINNTEQFIQNNRLENCCTSAGEFWTETTECIWVRNWVWDNSFGLRDWVPNWDTPTQTQQNQEGSNHIYHWITYKKARKDIGNKVLTENNNNANNFFYIK